LGLMIKSSLNFSGSLESQNNLYIVILAGVLSI
jgi:hypothetical protein